MSQTDAISPNGINYLRTLEINDKSTISIDTVLQIYSIKQNQSKANKTFFSLTLQDRVEKLGGFLLMPKSPDCPPTIGDVIRITSVLPFKSGENRIFNVKSYTTIAIGAPLLNTPNSSDCQIDLTPNSAVKEKTHSSMPLNPVNRYSEFDESACQLISTLTTFTKSPRWYVKVIKMYDIKDFVSRANQQKGKLLNVLLCDTEGTEIQATMFNNVVDKFQNVLKLNNFYEITGGVVKMNDRKYGVTRLDYKLTFDENTEIKEVGDNGNFHESEPRYVKIESMKDMSNGWCIDVLAYVLSADDKRTINTKKGETELRRVVLGDATGFKVELTLWRQHADQQIQSGDYVSIRNVTISDFNGRRSLNSKDETKITLNPNNNDIKSIQAFVKQGFLWKDLQSSSSNDHSTIWCEGKTLRDMLKKCEESIDDSNNETFRFKATVSTWNHSERNYYPACPDKQCKKKVNFESGAWYCEKCAKTIDKPIYYYTLSVRLMDGSMKYYADIFGDIGKIWMKYNAEEYMEFITNKDTVKFNEINDESEFRQFYFTGKFKNQIYKDMNKRRWNIFRIEEVDVKAEMNKLVKKLTGWFMNKY